MPKEGDLGALSIEVGHMYLDRMDEETIEAEARRAKKLLDTYARDVVESASLVVLLDNYNRYPGSELKKWRPERRAQEQVVEEFERQGVVLDFVVWEGSLAESVDKMLERLVPEPRRGEGSVKGAESPLFAKEAGWLSNGDVGRPDDGAQKTGGGGVLIRDDKSDKRDHELKLPRHRNAISLDVQLWSGPKEDPTWACPSLAAWWQLVRLGALQILGRKESQDPQYPAGTWYRDKTRPLGAKRTLTFLDIEYIEVEHAVWNILRQVVLDDAWAQLLQDSDQKAPPHAHLERMTYVFTPSVDLRR